jgi:hypothetical protein
MVSKITVIAGRKPPFDNELHSSGGSHDVIGAPWFEPMRLSRIARTAAPASRDRDDPQAASASRSMSRRPLQAEFEEWAIMNFEQPIGDVNSVFGIDADQGRRRPRDGVW